MITIELFIANPRTGTAVIASFETTKGDKLYDFRRTTMRQLKVKLEAENLSCTNIMYKRLTSDEQSIVIESHQRRDRNHNAQTQP